MTDTARLKREARIGVGVGFAVAVALTFYLSVSLGWSWYLWLPAGIAALVITPLVCGQFFMTLEKRRDRRDE
jgi:hypothetical protein